MRADWSFYHATQMLTSQLAFGNQGVYAQDVHSRWPHLPTSTMAFSQNVVILPDALPASPSRKPGAVTKLITDDLLSPVVGRHRNTTFINV